MVFLETTWNGQFIRISPSNLFQPFQYHPKPPTLLSTPPTPTPPNTKPLTTPFTATPTNPFHSTQWHETPPNPFQPSSNPKFLLVFEILTVITLIVVQVSKWFSYFMMAHHNTINCSTIKIRLFFQILHCHNQKCNYFSSH